MSMMIGASICAMLLGMPLSLFAATESRTRLGTDTEAPPQRLALLVGNSKYQYLNPLKNPKNDVDQLAAKLQQFGFQTTVKHDLNHNDFVEVLSDFGNRIGPGDVALFYYSGHGVQQSGLNYLIPVDMKSPPNAVILQGNGVSVEQVRGALSGSKLSLMILDACRTYPNFQVKGLLAGLAPLFPRGVLVAYAADEGQAALDNDNENVSLFTKYLIEELDKPDKTLCELFDGVREAVDKASHNVQFPFVYDGVIGDFVFNRTTTEESRKLGALSNTVGRTNVWTAIQKSDNPNDFAAFLAHPWDTAHVKVAEDRLSSLMSSTVKAVGVVPLDAQAPPEAVSVANQGQRLFYEEAYEEAVKAYGKLVQSRPSDVLVLYDYATCLLHFGSRDEAIQFFSRAVELNPEFPWAYYNRGVAHHLKGDLKEATDDYTRALERRPSYALGYNNLAVAKRDAGDLAGAEQVVQKTIALDPNYAPAFFNRARILNSLGDINASVALLRKGNNLLMPAADYTSF